MHWLNILYDLYDVTCLVITQLLSCESMFLNRVCLKLHVCLFVVDVVDLFALSRCI